MVVGAPGVRARRVARGRLACPSSLVWCLLLQCNPAIEVCAARHRAARRAPHAPYTEEQCRGGKLSKVMFHELREEG